MLVVPIPRLGVDRLADAAKHPQAAEVERPDVVCAKAAEETDGGGRGVELGDLVLVDGLPVSRGSGVDGRRFEDGGGYAVRKGAVHDVPEAVYFST